MDALLYDQEWEFLFKMIYRLNSLSNITHFQSVCLEQLRVLIPNAKSVFLLDERQDAKIISHSPVCISTKNMTFNENFFRNNVLRRTCQEYYFEQESHAFRISDVVDYTNWPHMLLYKNVYAPLDIYYALKIVLIHNDCLLGDISLYRQKYDEDFSLRDLRIAALIKDHLAMKLQKLRQGAARKSEIVQEKSEYSDFRFTYRETEVLKLLSEGKTDQQICELLSISLYTLKNHIHNIYHKTGAKNRVQILLLTGQMQTELIKFSNLGWEKVILTKL